MSDIDNQIMVDAIQGSGGQIYNITVELSSVVNNSLAINPQVQTYTTNITVTVISNTPPIFSTLPDIKLLVPYSYNKNYSKYIYDKDSSSIVIQMEYNGPLSLYKYWFNFENNMISISNLTNDLQSNSTLRLNAHDEWEATIINSNYFNLEIRANHPPTLSGSVNKSITIYRNEPLTTIDVSNLAFNDFEETFNVIAVSSSNQSQIFSSLNYSNGTVSFKVNDSYVGSTQIYVEIVDNDNQIAKTPINVTVLDWEIPKCVKCYSDLGKACLKYNQNLLEESQSNCEYISHEIAFSVTLFWIILGEIILIILKSSPVVLNHFIFNLQFFVFVWYIRWCTPYSFTNLTLSLKFIKFDLEFLKWMTYGLADKLSSSQILSSYYYLFVIILISIIVYIILLTSKAPFKNKQVTTFIILFKSFVYLFEFGSYSLIFMFFMSPMMFTGFRDLQNFSNIPIYMSLFSLIIIVGLFSIYIIAIVQYIVICCNKTDWYKPKDNPWNSLLSMFFQGLKEKKLASITIVLEVAKRIIMVLLLSLSDSFIKEGNLLEDKSYKIRIVVWTLIMFFEVVYTLFIIIVRPFMSILDYIMIIIMQLGMMSWFGIEFIFLSNPPNDSYNFRNFIGLIVFWTFISIMFFAISVITLFHILAQIPSIAAKFRKSAPLVDQKFFFFKHSDMVQNRDNNESEEAKQFRPQNLVMTARPIRKKILPQTPDEPAAQFVNFGLRNNSRVSGRQNNYQF